MASAFFTVLCPLPEDDITGFTTQGRHPCDRVPHLLQAFGIEILRCRQTQFHRRHLADAVTVHGHEGGARRGNDVQPASSYAFKTSVRIASTSGTMKSGSVLVDGSRQRGGVQHGEDLGLVGNLHGRGTGIGIAGHHMGAQPLGGDDELAAQFTRAEQQNIGDGRQRTAPSARGATLELQGSHSVPDRPGRGRIRAYRGSEYRFRSDASAN